MAGVKGRSGRPRKQQIEVRQQNLLMADKVIGRFLADKEIPDVSKIELAAKLVIKDMGVQASRENTKLLTQNNFFTQIINKAAQDVKKVSNSSYNEIIEVEAKLIDPDLKTGLET